MSDPIQKAGEQAVKAAAELSDAWADKLAAQGFSGAVRIMGQKGTEVTPVYERPIGAGPDVSLKTASLEQAALRWLRAKLEYDDATRDMEAAARKIRGW